MNGVFFWAGLGGKKILDGSGVEIEIEWVEVDLRYQFASIDFYYCVATPTSNPTYSSSK